LEVGRAELGEYLAALEQPYRVDASNADLSRTRARIRHDLLPRLAAGYNPKVAEALVRLGELAGASQRDHRRRVRALERSASRPGGRDELVLDRDELARLPRFLRAEVLRHAWRRAGWPEAGMGADQWHRLADLAHRPDARPMIVRGIAVTPGPLLVLSRPAPVEQRAQIPSPNAAVSLELPGVAPWLDGRIIATLDPDAPRDEVIDLDALAPPVCVRAPVAGDRFEPLGMGGQGTPLNDFFRGRRVPREHRGRVPLVCDRSGIVWVVGHRIAHHVRLTAASRRTVGLRWEDG
jgi:tRNA(Ile)-lysidine synthase